jgi:LacI family transcriptional regulator
MSRVTIAEVAKAAGVSKATVSRVLSGNHKYLTPETRWRVEQAIKQLDYRPSTVARSLTSKRTNTVGVLVADISNPFYPDVFLGIEDGAVKHGYNVFLCNTNYDLARGKNYIQSLVDKRVDGVLIMTSSFSREWLVELERNNVPVIVLDWEVQSRGSNQSTIAVDFERGIHAAVEHLYGLGHRRFAHVGGPPLLQTSRDRRNAFLCALAEYGIDRTEVPVIDGNLRIDAGRHAVKELLTLPQWPTAVFAANDMMAIGMLLEARTKGIRIPDDLSVVGLDDIWLAAQSEPPLTTVALPRYEIGQLAMRLLFDLLDRPREDYIETVATVVRTSLVIRQSTGPAPISTTAHVVSSIPSL